MVGPRGHFVKRRRTKQSAAKRAAPSGRWESASACSVADLKVSLPLGFGVVHFVLTLNDLLQKCLIYNRTLKT